MQKLTLDRRPRKPAFNLSREQLERDRSMMSVGYMAKHYGVSKSTIYRALRREGLITHADES